jgi:hypothetical protein
MPIATEYSFHTPRLLMGERVIMIEIRRKTKDRGGLWHKEKQSSRI